MRELLSDVVAVVVVVAAVVVVVVVVVFDLEMKTASGKRTD